MHKGAYHSVSTPFPNIGVFLHSLADLINVLRRQAVLKKEP